MGQPAAVISDHGVMYSLVRFVQYAQKKGQRPIVAMEAYVVENRHIKGKQEGEAEATNKREHLLLIAKNQTGYRNLMKLASLGATEGFYYRPRIDDELLKKYSEGLIATSACLGSRFSQLILRGDVEGAKKELKKYARWFPDSFYIEIQPTKEYAQKIVNHTIIGLAQELGIPLVATSDAHYLKREDSQVHDTLLAVQSKSSLQNPKRWRFTGDTYFVASRAEMKALFAEDCECRIEGNFRVDNQTEWKVEEDDQVFYKTVKMLDGTTEDWYYVRFKHNLPDDVIEEALDNTVNIINQVELEINWGEHFLPKVDIPLEGDFKMWMDHRNARLKAEGKQPDGTSEAYLRYLCIKGLKNRNKTESIYRERLEYELGVINSMGFADYFLILEEIISWCHKNHIPVGPGRGCFTPGQLVTMRDGTLKRIENVKAGDYVLTHRCNYQEVKGVHKYQTKEDVAIVTLEAMNGKAITIQSTKDHEYFAMPKHMERDFKNVKWTMAGELVNGDVILMPIAHEHAHAHSHKGHEECLSCQGRPNPEWLEEINRKYHETAMNTNRVLEKSMLTLHQKVQGSAQSVALMEIQDSLKDMQEVFGFNEVLQSSKDINVFAEELEELGYEIAFVRNVEYVAYDGDVYDLAVDVDTSYVVNGLAVHNSGAGSIVAYATGITNVDPIEYDLLFERFLNPERGKLPDIDTDVCIVNRPKIINHIIETYGKTHVASIAALGRLQTKAVIKDVGRVFDLEPFAVNAFTGRLPSGPAAIGYHIKDVLSDSQYDDFTKRYPELFNIARKLEGSPRHVSQHAAGIVISPPGYEVWDFTPVDRAKETDGEVGYRTQLEKEEVETVGLVKLDLLGLKNVTEIDHMVHMVNQLYNLNMTTNDIPLDDAKTWDLVCTGNTLGVFQFSSNLALDACRRVKPRNIEELAAVNTLIRPGANAGMELYLRGKKDPSKVKYLTPALKPFLEKTYGAMIFQEQTMQIIAHFADISFGQADLYRRMFEKVAKGKVAMDGPEMNEFREKLYAGAEKRGYSKELADRAVDMIMDGVGYAFNKSHSVAYSILGYWTAYFKANYPLVFYTVMLNGNPDAIALFMEEAKKNNIDVLPPHVNSSKHGFTIDGDSAVRAGLSAIKGVGPRALDSIIMNQPFDSIDDFLARNESRTVNKKVVDALIGTGAMDDMGILVQPTLDIAKSLKPKFTVDNNMVFLNRYQLKAVWDKVGELTTKKTVPNFLVPKALIKGKYLNEYEMVEETGGFYVIPEPYCMEMGIDITTVEKTRKKPKGSFTKAKDPYTGYSDIRKAFVISAGEICDLKTSFLEMYLKESDELGFSFMSHPLEGHLNKIQNFADADDGQLITTAGIITEIVERKTQGKGKLFYNVFVRTPRETVKLTVWENFAKKYPFLLKRHELIVAQGTKAFGGLTIDTVKHLNFKG